MGFTTSNLSLYHTFSKTPVDSNVNSAAAQLGNAINKSGHTVQSNEIWTESIPFFGLAATTTAIHNKFSTTAKVNDLVKDSDGKIWQRNSIAYTEGATFANLWTEKTKSITSFTKGTDGNYTFTETDGALVDGSYLLNSEGVPTVKYYEKRLLTRLTADNNANTNSDNKASRLQIDGKWIDQFIGVTDIYLNGSAAVSYAPVLRKTASSSPMQSGPGKAYMDYCATGLILWESSAAGTEVIDCFEYVGTKLDATVAKLSAAVFGSNNGGSDQPVDLVTQVNLNTAAIATLNGDADETGSVANQIASATSTLASKSEITINDIKVKVGSGTATSLVPDNKSVTIEIPDAPEADVTAEGAVTTDGFTKTAAVTSLAKAAIKAALADTAEGSLGDKISDVESIASQAKTTADSAVQSVTRATGSSELITVTDGTDVTITLSTEVATKTDAANAASEAITTSLAGTTEGTIGKAISDVDAKAQQGIDDAADALAKANEVDGKLTPISEAITAAQATADAKVASVTGPTSGLVTVNTNSDTKAVTIAVSDKLASADDITITGITLNSKGLTATNKVVNITAIEGVTTTAVNGIALAKDGNNVKVTVTPATYTSSTKTWTNETNVATASDVKAAIADAVGDIIIPDVTTSSIAQTVGVTASGHEVSIVTADYTPANGDTTASWTDKGHLVTGATVETFVGAETAKTLEAAKAYSDSLHTTSLDYVVLGDSESLPTASAETLGKIYLVAKQNAPVADGSAISGDYVEYMTRKVSETEYTWEKIGTTAADLTDYVTNSSLTTTLAGYVTTVEKTVLEGQISAAQKAAQDAQTSADSKVATTTYEAKVDELEEAISNAKPANYVKTVTVGTTTTSGETALTINDGRTTIYPNDLWGTTVSMVGNTITVQGGPIDGTEWHAKFPLVPSQWGQRDDGSYGYISGSTSYEVKDNKLQVVGGETLANIKTNELVNGSSMFYSTSLDVESVELICDVLPNYNTENGGKTLQTATWNGKKYTYSDWNGTSAFYYPIININNNWNSMSQGNADGIDRSFGTESISASNVKSIRITWSDISVLSEADRTAITQLFTDTATEKGWTFITNTELGGTVSPNAIMTTDGTIQYYVLAKKDEATEDNATHIDASGKLWKFDTAEAIIGPNIKYWSMFATVEDALTEWELTSWTKPTEEETEA